MTSLIITLLTDFGLRDPYVAEMKGVILDICPRVNIVDVSHDIEKFNVRSGAIVLASASQFFPKGTINVAVVDPGVGTERRGLCVETSRGFFIGPDNGVLVLATRTQGIEHVHVIENSRYFLPEVSHTFHGRDIFAPVAAHIANGVSPLDIGPETSRMVVPGFGKIVKGRKSVTGEVVYVDSFRNVITNITGKDLEGVGLCQESRLRVDDIRARLRFCNAYGEVEVGEPLALIGSHGFLEISVNQGDASTDFGLKIGDKITVRT
jgi:S-adenosyl-L-methionine hydrolase (adenosine-forming)